MPVTGFFSDNEVRWGRAGCGDPSISKLVRGVRELTGEDWIAVRQLKFCDRGWWRKAESVEFWTIARYVGGAGPWQIHGAPMMGAEQCAAYLQCIADGAFSRSIGFPTNENKEQQ